MPVHAIHDTWWFRVGRARKVVGSDSLTNVIQTPHYSTETSPSWARDQELKRSRDVLRRKAEELRLKNVSVPNLREAARAERNTERNTQLTAAAAKPSPGTRAEQGTQAGTPGSDAVPPGPSQGRPNVQGAPSARSPQASHSSSHPKEGGAAFLHAPPQAHQQNAQVGMGPGRGVRASSAQPPPAAPVRGRSSTVRSEERPDVGRHNSASYAPAFVGGDAQKPVSQDLLLRMLPELDELLAPSTSERTGSAQVGMSLADDILSHAQAGAVMRNGQNGARSGEDSFFPAAPSQSQSKVPPPASNGINGFDGSGVTNGSHGFNGSSITNGSPGTNGSSPTNGSPGANGGLRAAGQSVASSASNGGRQPISGEVADNGSMHPTDNGGGIRERPRVESTRELVGTVSGTQGASERVSSNDEVAAWGGGTGREPSIAPHGVPWEPVLPGQHVQEASSLSSGAVDVVESVRSMPVSLQSPGTVLQPELCGGTEASHVHGACQAQGAQSHKVPDELSENGSTGEEVSHGRLAGPPGSDWTCPMQVHVHQDGAALARPASESAGTQRLNSFDWSGKPPFPGVVPQASSTAVPKPAAAVPGDQQTRVVTHLTEEGRNGNGREPENSPLVVPGDQGSPQGAEAQMVLDVAVGPDGSVTLHEIGDTAVPGPLESTAPPLEASTTAVPPLPEHIVTADAACTTSHDAHGSHVPPSTPPDPGSPTESAVLERPPAPDDVEAPHAVTRVPDPGNLHQEEVANRGKSGAVGFARWSRTEDDRSALPLLYRNAWSGTVQYALWPRTESGGAGAPLRWDRQSGRVVQAGPRPAVQMQETAPVFERDVMYLLLGRLLEEHRDPRRERRDAAAAKLYAEGLEDGPLEDGLPVERYEMGLEDGTALKRYGEGWEDASAVERYREGLERSARGLGPRLDFRQDADGDYPSTSLSGDSGSPGAAGPFLPTGRDAISRHLLMGTREQGPVLRDWAEGGAVMGLQQSMDGVSASEQGRGPTGDPVMSVPVVPTEALLEESTGYHEAGTGSEVSGAALAHPEEVEEVLGEQVLAADRLEAGEDAVKAGEEEEVVEADWEVPKVEPPPGVWVVDSVAEAERVVQLLCGRYRDRTFGCDTEVRPFDINSVHPSRASNGHSCLTCTATTL